MTHCGTLRLGNWQDKLLGDRSVDGEWKRVKASLCSWAMAVGKDGCTEHASRARGKEGIITEHRRILKST